MTYKLILIEKSHLALIYSKESVINLLMEHCIYKINDIYLGRVTRILPSLDAAFISLNSQAKNGFIHFGCPKENRKVRYPTTNPIIYHNKNILVQITREPVGTKGPSVTCDISLIGKYLALFPLSQSIRITKKINNEDDKEYLQSLGYLLQPRTMGILMKVDSLSANVDFLIKEQHILKTRWINAVNKSKTVMSPALVSKKQTLINKIFENYSYDILPFNTVAVDSHEAALKLKKILSKLYSSNYPKKLVIEVHCRNLFLIKRYLVDLIISDLMKPRVNLPGGGYIVIEKTEALTTIDINSGSFTTLSNSRETSLWINYSATHEILKQLKLRNIGGIIIIDFIDSTNQTDQMQILQYMSRLMKKDSLRCTIIQMSELGLVEIIRTRYGQSIYDAFTRRCNMCNGLGYLPSGINKEKEFRYELSLDLNPLKFNLSS